MKQCPPSLQGNGKQPVGASHNPEVNPQDVPVRGVLSPKQQLKQQRFGFGNLKKNYKLAVAKQRDVKCSTGNTVSGPVRTL